MERNETLDRAMKYSRAAGLELADMLASINSKVNLLTPRVPDQHMFGSDGVEFGG